MPIYVVTNTGVSPAKQVLVQAPTKAAAIRYVSAPQFGAHVADQATLVRMLQAGAKVEDAKATEAGGDE